MAESEIKQSLSDQAAPTPESVPEPGTAPPPDETPAPRPPAAQTEIPQSPPPPDTPGPRPPGQPDVADTADTPVTPDSGPGPLPDEVPQPAAQKTDFAPPVRPDSAPVTPADSSPDPAAQTPPDGDPNPADQTPPGAAEAVAPDLPLWAQPAAPTVPELSAHPEAEPSDALASDETGTRASAPTDADTAAEAAADTPPDTAPPPSTATTEADSPADTGEPTADSPATPDAPAAEAAAETPTDAATTPTTGDASDDATDSSGTPSAPDGTPHQTPRRPSRPRTPTSWKRLAGSTPAPSPGPAAGKRRRTAVITLATVLVVVLVGAPTWGVSYFAARAKPGVTVLGHSVAGQTRAELTTTLTSLDDSLSLPWTAGSTTIQTLGTDVGVTLDVPQSVAKALAEDGPHSPWTTYIPWQKKPAPVSVTIDQAKLQDSLDRAFVPDGEGAREASVAYDESQGQFVAQPSRTGVRAQIDPVIEQLRAEAALGTFDPITVTIDTDVPVFTNEAAQQAAGLANARLGLALTLTDGQTGWSERSYQIPAATLASWAVITPNAGTGQFDLTWDSAKMTADLTPVLTDQIGTPMKPTVTVMDPRSPEDILGYEWGHDGTKVADLPGTVEVIRQALTQGQDLTYTVPLVPDPATETQQLPPTNFDEPNGAKWIDVNKTTYLATAYEGTTQVNQFIISIGRGGPYETSDGTHYIYLKYDYQVMRGGTGRVEGRYEYATPVTWVSYFNADQAFHQADWNTWQGTWQERVSHGCVNMRGEDAQWIFDWAPIGTKVVVHY